jgi:hypothetical protein
MPKLEIVILKGPNLLLRRKCQDMLTIPLNVLTGRRANYLTKDLKYCKQDSCCRT